MSNPTEPPKPPPHPDTPQGPVMPQPAQRWELIESARMGTDKAKTLSAHGYRLRAVAMVVIPKQGPTLDPTATIEPEFVAIGWFVRLMIPATKAGKRRQAQYAADLETFQRERDHFLNAQVELAKSDAKQDA